MNKKFKKTNKFIYFILVCCVLMMAVASFNVIKLYANTESKAVAKVLDTEYDNYNDAWSAVKNGGTITMLGDWYTTELLTVGKNVSITIDMNGYMINRGLTKDDDSGEIFLVKEKGMLILNGNNVNTTEHWGTVQNGKWNYQGKEKGNVLINGSLLTGGYNEDGGGAIHIQKEAEVRIDGVTIAGNASTDKYIGGAIRLQGERSKLTLTNSTISYNRSEDGGGAAICVEGEDSLVQINNSKLHHNICNIDTDDGGAIQIDNGTVDIKNSVISFNEAGENGGAIYVYNGNLSIDKKTVFAYNVANKEGGAIYVNSKADKVKIEGTYIGNTASEEGGAVYVNSSISGENGVKISNVEMIGNIAKENGGGAVYVDSDNNISLSDQVIMHGNTPDNLHIRATDAIKENNLTDGSKVGIYTSWDANQKSPVKTKNPKYFFSDKLGYEVITGNDLLYFIEGEEGAPSSYKVDEVEYALIKSRFNYTALAGGTMNPEFYYSDGYFAEIPKYYNEHLGSLAASMALAAMPALYEGEYNEESSAKNIVDMFVSMGFSEVFVHYPKPEYFGPDAENLSTIGYAIAKRTTVINGKETTIIATAVRGSDYGAEWASNVTLGSGLGEAQGFGDAAKQVKQGIDEYISKYNIDTDAAKFLITGYSRAGATSNIVAKKLTDIYGENQVYAYCFEAPQGGVYTELKDGLTYTNIHNIINGVDIVATVGPKQMGFMRYGVDHIIPSGKVGSAAYNRQKELMLAQLAAVNGNIQHNDYFHEASLEYIFSKVGIFDLISENWFVDFDCPNDWVPFFIQKLQEYGFSDLNNNSNANKDNIFNNESNKFNGYRNFWSDYEWYLYFDENNKLKIKDYANKPNDADTVDYIVLSVEDAIANLMKFYYGSTDEKKDAIVSALDVNAIMKNIDMMQIYMVIIDEWNDLTIDEKNKEFNELWQSLNIEKPLKNVLTPEEMETLLSSFYVVADFLLDFVAEDYDETDQDVLGTLLHNIGNIIQTHYHDVTYSWVRSYDSYYSDIEYECVHNYSEWTVVKEATTEDYGVQMKTCSQCHESIYEAILKIATEDNTPVEPGDNNPTTTASLFGKGSVLAIILCSIIMIGVVVCVYIYKKIEVNKVLSSKDTNGDE